MKKYFVFISAVALAVVISCSPAKKESNSEAVQQLKQLQQTTLSADTSAAIATVPAATATTQPAAIQTASTPPELNPPHGQPYHRCDIPVGSPLNTPAPAKPAPAVNRTGTSPTLANAAKLNNPQAVSPTAPTVANATSGKPKLNPPHGQPYHRCDIAVGSPLP
jgi:hypothetical protein